MGWLKGRERIEPPILLVPNQFAAKCRSSANSTARNSFGIGAHAESFENRQIFGAHSATKSSTSRTRPDQVFRRIFAVVAPADIGSDSHIWLLLSASCSGVDVWALHN